MFYILCCSSLSHPGCTTIEDGNNEAGLRRPPRRPPKHGMDPNKDHLYLQNPQALYGVESAALAPGYSVKRSDL